MQQALRLAWLAILVAGGLRAFGADVSPGEITSQKWLAVKLGELTVITDVSEGKLREWTSEMSWFQNGLQSVLPLPAGRKGEPATLFLFKSDRMMRRFLPDHGKNPMLLAGFYSSVAGQNVGLLAMSGSRFDVRAKLFHEMTHWHLGGTGADVPLWFQEGMAQVFETFTLQGDAFRLGHNQPELLERVRMEGTPALEPMLRRTEVDFSRAGWKHGQTSLFYAQSWSLTHLLLFGTKTGSLARATNYLDALRAGMTDTAAFTTGLGVTPELAREWLDVYVRVPTWRFLTRPLDRSASRASFQVAVLEPAELYQHFGMLLLAAGRMSEAAPFIAFAGAADGGIARNWELAGILALNGGPAERMAADEALEKARSRKSQNPWVYVMLGWRTQEGMEWGEDPASAQRREERLREAGRYFLEAVALRPDFKPAIEGLAGILLTSIKPNPDFRSAFRAGMSPAAGSTLVQVAMADDEIRAGQLASAANRLQQLLRREAELSAEMAARVRVMLAAAQPAPAGRP